jgi:hypothetical protein
VGITDNLIEALRSIVPEERFAAFQIKAATAFAAEDIDCRDDLREIQIHRPARINPAMPTAQIAAVGEHHPSDEGRRFPEKKVAGDVVQAERTGFQYLLSIVRRSLLLSISLIFGFYGGEPASNLNVFLPAG